LSAKKKAKQKRVARIRRRHAQKRRQRITGRHQFRDSKPDLDILDGSAIGLPRLSETILAYASPLLEDAETKEERSSCIALAVTAWNASFLPDDRWRQSLWEGEGRPIPSDDEWRDLEQLLSRMVELKRAFFADEARMVLDYELSFERGRARLFVASTMAEAPPELETDYSPAEATQSRQLSLALSAT
jgi:hypothetical protein